MSVLGQKVTKLDEIDYIQPGDTFLAIRGGISYKVFGNRVASVEQLNAAKTDFNFKLQNLENTAGNRLATIDLRLNDLTNTMFLKTAGNTLSSAVFSLSSQVLQLRTSTATTTYVDTVSSNIVNWTKLNFVRGQNSYVPLPTATNVYSNVEGSVLTWNATTNTWQYGPGLSVIAKTDVAPVGTIILYGGSTAPQGYLPCNGQAVAKVDYPDLWTAIADTYGRPVGLSNDLFQLPNLSGIEIMAADTLQDPARSSSIPISFCIKSLNVNPSSASAVLSSYLKISSQYTPSNNQYIKYSNGEWIPSNVTSTTLLPSAATAGSLLTWSGTGWVAGSSKVQSIREHSSIVAYENTECIFTDIPSAARKITLVISDLDITSASGTFVKLKLGNNPYFIDAGYNNGCQGTFANPYQRTGGGFYSYITNSTLPVDAAYLLVRIDDFITKNETGGLDAIVTLMRSYTSLLSPTSKWVYTHTGHIGATVVHGAGSVLLPNSQVPDTIGIFPPNPTSLITRGQITLYWE